MPAHLDPEPRAVERAQHGQVEVLGEVLVEAELVDRVVAGHPAPHERQQRGDVPLDVVGRDAGGLGRHPHRRDAGGQQLLDAGGDTARARHRVGDGWGTTSSVTPCSARTFGAPVRRAAGFAVAGRRAAAGGGRRPTRAGCGRAAEPGGPGAGGRRSGPPPCGSGPPWPPDAAGACRSRSAWTRGPGSRRRRGVAASVPGVGCGSGCRLPAGAVVAPAAAMSGVLRRLARSPEARAAPAARAPVRAGFFAAVGFFAACFLGALAPDVEAISRSSLQPTRG